MKFVDTIRRTAIVWCPLTIRFRRSSKFENIVRCSPSLTCYACYYDHFRVRCKHFAIKSVSVRTKNIFRRGDPSRPSEWDGRKIYQKTIRRLYYNVCFLPFAKKNISTPVDFRKIVRFLDWRLLNITNSRFRSSFRVEKLFLAWHYFLTAKRKLTYKFQLSKWN